MEPQNEPSLLDADPHTPTKDLIPIPKRQPTKKPAPQQPKFDSRYLPLLKSIIQEQWDTAESLLSGDKDALRAGISGTKTVLHVAVSQSNHGANRFAARILNLVAPEDLVDVTDGSKRTVLHEAAVAGNFEAVVMVINKNRDLLLVPDEDDALPLHLAASFGHKDLSEYLLRVTPHEADPCPFAGNSGFSILYNFIDAQFYDLAVKMVERYPELATKIKKGDEEKDGDDMFASGELARTPSFFNSDVAVKVVERIYPKLAAEIKKGEEEEKPYDMFALGELARTPSSFYSGIRLNLLQRFLYRCIPIPLEKSPLSKGGDIENVHDFDAPQHPYSCCSKLFGAQSLVPYVKHIYNIKNKHIQATKLLECLCKKLEESNDENVRAIIGDTLHLAAEYGIVEIVEHILKTFPFAFGYEDGDNHSILDIAILHRREKVFNLIYQMSECKFVVTQSTDYELNHSLHLAAQLAPPHRLDKIPGPALQMQHELQWFQEVKKFIKPSFIRTRNRENKTPRMIFSEEHKDLIKEGEKWMNGMAKSCITAATLLTTLAFAAAITTPGGNDNDGKPVFFHTARSKNDWEHQQIFLMFVVSNAVSLFSSVGAIIMFLSILTSRYAEKDFLYALPRRLIFGLASLFVSITSMMIAFGGALYLILNQKQTWVLILVGVLAWLPVTLFVTLQFPLLMTMVKSTFGSSLFGRQSKVKLY